MLGYLWLKGRCRHCYGLISPRYLLVELALLGLFAFAAGQHLRLLQPTLEAPPEWGAFLVLFLRDAVLCLGLLLAALIDLDHRIIPDEVTLGGILLGLVYSAAFPATHAPLPGWIVQPNLAALTASAYGAVVGAGSLYVVGLMGRALFRKEAMGLGDVKFMAAVGAFLGALDVLMVFGLACVIGAVIGIVYRLATRRHYVPFGPFLALGAFVMVFAGEQLWTALKNLRLFPL